MTNKSRVVGGYFFYHPQLIKIDELSPGTYVKVVERHGTTVTVVPEKDIRNSYSTTFELPVYVIFLSDLTYNK